MRPFLTTTHKKFMETINHIKPLTTLHLHSNVQIPKFLEFILFKFLKKRLTHL